MSKVNRVNLSCTVTKDVKDKLSLIADFEDQTVSRLAAKAIKFYIQDQERKSHPALPTKNLKKTEDNVETESSG